MRVCSDWVLVFWRLAFGLRVRAGLLLLGYAVRCVWEVCLGGVSWLLGLDEWICIP